MIRSLLAALFSIALISLAPLAAEDKKKDDAKAKTYEGKLVCTKCTLKETKTCGHALKVKEGDKEVTYYVSDMGAKETYHKGICPADSEAECKVTGKLVEKDGKKTITDAKVEMKK
ncbi:hypothetical protein BH11PLA2_BH11PLA2_45170 [soil metagenome]